MFEVGFSEILMVGLVALLVIGPEKLPKVAKMAGFWIAKSKRMVAAVKQEINEEFQAEELRQSLRNQSGISEFKQLIEDTTSDLNKIRNKIDQQANNSDSIVNTVKRDE